MNRKEFIGKSLITMLGISNLSTLQHLDGELSFFESIMPVFFHGPWFAYEWNRAK